MGPSPLRLLPVEASPLPGLLLEQKLLLNKVSAPLTRASRTLVSCLGIYLDEHGVPVAPGRARPVQPLVLRGGCRPHSSRPRPELGSLEYELGVVRESVLEILGLAEGPVAALAHGNSAFWPGLPAWQFVYGEVLRVGARLVDITLIKQVRLRG